MLCSLWWHILTIDRLTGVFPDVHGEERDWARLCEWVISANCLCDLQAGRCVHKPCPSGTEGGKTCSAIKLLGRLSDPAELCRASFRRFLSFLVTSTMNASSWFTCCCELSTELVIASELLVDKSGDFAGRCTATVGLHAVPVECVVPTLGGVVEKTLVCSYQASSGRLEKRAVRRDCRRWTKTFFVVVLP